MLRRSVRRAVQRHSSDGLGQPPRSDKEVAEAIRALGAGCGEGRGAYQRTSYAAVTTVRRAVVALLRNRVDVAGRLAFGAAAQLFENLLMPARVLDVIAIAQRAPLLRSSSTLPLYKHLFSALSLRNDAPRAMAVYYQHLHPAFTPGSPPCDKVLRSLLFLNAAASRASRVAEPRWFPLSSDAVLDAMELLECGPLHASAEASVATSWARDASDMLGLLAERDEDPFSPAGRLAVVKAAQKAKDYATSGWTGGQGDTSTPLEPSHPTPTGRLPRPERRLPAEAPPTPGRLPGAGSAEIAGAADAAGDRATWQDFPSPAGGGAIVSDATLSDVVMTAAGHEESVFLRVVTKLEGCGRRLEWSPHGLLFGAAAHDLVAWGSAVANRQLATKDSSLGITEMLLQLHATRGDVAAAEGVMVTRPHGKVTTQMLWKLVNAYAVALLTAAPPRVYRRVLTEHRVRGALVARAVARATLAAAKRGKPQHAQGPETPAEAPAPQFHSQQHAQGPLSPSSPRTPEASPSPANLRTQSDPGRPSLAATFEFLTTATLASASRLPPVALKELGIAAYLQHRQDLRADQGGVPATFPAFHRRICQPAPSADEPPALFLYRTYQSLASNPDTSGLSLTLLQPMTAVFVDLALACTSEDGRITLEYRQWVDGLRALLEAAVCSKDVPASFAHCVAPLRAVCAALSVDFARASFASQLQLLALSSEPPPPAAVSGGFWSKAFLNSYLRLCVANAAPGLAWEALVAAHDEHAVDLFEDDGIYLRMYLAS
eukprot:gene15676-23933_t